MKKKPRNKSEGNMHKQYNDFQIDEGNIHKKIH